MPARPPRLLLQSPTLLAIGALAGVSVPAGARANGVTAHAHITDLAIEELPPGELRDLMTDPALRDAYRTGSVFPDSGYAASDAYGEIAHWEPFTQAYLDWMAAEHPPPYETDDERRLVLFIMGQASHGLADQIYDSLFMHRMRVLDGDDSHLDEYNEYWLVMEHEPGIAPLTIWAPVPELPDVFAAEASGHRPEIATLEMGLGRIRGVVNILPTLARGSYARTWSELPWAATNYYIESTPGSLPHIATYVARYWQVLWERLHGTDPLNTPIIGTRPAEGAENHEVSPTSPEMRVMVVFGHGIDAMTLTRENVTLTSAEGTVVSAQPRFIYGSSFANAVLIDPEETLAFDTEYRVSVGTEVRDIEGRALPEPISLTFHTRCAPDRLADCPPLPPPWMEPVGGPPAGDAGPRPDGGPPPDAAPSLDASALDASPIDASADVAPPARCGCRAASPETGTTAGVLGALFLAAAARRRRARA